MNNIVGSVMEGLKISADIIEKLEATAAIITGERKPEEVTAEAHRDCLMRDIDQLMGNLMLIREMTVRIQEMIYGANEGAKTKREELEYCR